MARLRPWRRLWACALLCLSVGMLIGAPLSVGVSVRSTSPPLPLTAANGGTGQTSYAVGDLLSADTTTTLSPVADVAAGAYLRSGGVSTLPLWSTLTLPNAATTGDVLYATGTNAIGRLADVAVGQILTAGGVGAAPTWGAKGTTGNCVQWTGTGLGDTGNACGGAAGGGIAGYSAAAITFTGTQYFPPVGGGPPSSTETAVDAESPSAGTITNFYAVVNTALPAATTLVFTFRTNAADTAVTCTMTAGNTDCRDVTHSFTPAAQDKLDVKVVTTGAVTATNLQFTYQYGTTGSNGTVNSGTIHQLAYYNGTGTAVSGEATAGASGTYVKSNGTDWGTSSGSASGTGACTNQAVTGVNSDAAPTCTTLTSAYVNSSILNTATAPWAGTQTATSGRYLKGDGTNWNTSSGSASGTGSCTGGVVTATNSDAAPTCATAPTLTAGGGTQTYKLGGTLYWEYTNTGNAADTLYISTAAYSLPAGTLATNGDQLTVELLLVFDATASTKTMTCNIGYTSFDTTAGFTGGHNFASFATTTVSASPFIVAKISRITATSSSTIAKDIIASVQDGGWGSGSPTWANANNILCIAKSSVATANIVTIKELRITWSPR